MRRRFDTGQTLLKKKKQTVKVSKPKKTRLAKTFYRVPSLAEQAEQSVGYDTWSKLDSTQRDELIRDLIASGIVEIPQFKDGGVSEAQKYKIVYYLKDNPSEIKEKIFDDEEKANDFFEIMSEDEDVVVKPKELLKKEESKPKKSLFETAKKVEKKAASKKDRERVQVDGIASEIRRYDELKATINNAKAEQEIIRGRLKAIGTEKFLDMYESQRRRPANFDLSDGDADILVEFKDDYIKVEPEKAAILENYDNLLETATTYEFNKEILERKVNDTLTVGDVVSDLIQSSKLLSEQDKQNLITVKIERRVPKGTINRLMEYDNPREIFEIIQPIIALK